MSLEATSALQAIQLLKLEALELMEALLVAQESAQPPNLDTLHPTGLPHTALAPLEPPKSPELVSLEPLKVPVLSSLAQDQVPLSAPLTALATVSQAHLEPPASLMVLEQLELQAALAELQEPTELPIPAELQELEALPHTELAPLEQADLTELPTHQAVEAVADHTANPQSLAQDTELELADRSVEHQE